MYCIYFFFTFQVLLYSWMVYAVCVMSCTMWWVMCWPTLTSTPPTSFCQNSNWGILFYLYSARTSFWSTSLYSVSKGDSDWLAFKESTSQYSKWLSNFEFLLSTFKFERQNNAGCCKQCFHFQFNFDEEQSFVYRID